MKINQVVLKFNFLVLHFTLPKNYAALNKEKASNEKKPYQELYENLKNPLDNPVVIEKLIENYATSINNLGGFYGRLSERIRGEAIYGCRI